MTGEHEPMLIGREPDQRTAHQRRRGGIKALGTILLQDVGQTLFAAAFIQQRQIDASPTAAQPAAPQSGPAGRDWYAQSPPLGSHGAPTALAPPV